MISVTRGFQYFAIIALNELENIILLERRLIDTAASTSQYSVLVAICEVFLANNQRNHTISRHTVSYWRLCNYAPDLLVARPALTHFQEFSIGVRAEAG